MEITKLFCIPYSGGSAMRYNEWKSHLDSRIQLYPLELAGRGRRFHQSLYNNISEVVDDLYKTVEREITHSNYAFFGHSLGGIIVYELAHKLIETIQRYPQHLFFSGSNPPHIKYGEKMLHVLSDDEFMQEIFMLGGTSQQVISNKEIVEVFLPIIRSDYRMFELYQYSPKPLKFSCDITVLLGANDKTINKDNANEWTQYTDAKCDVEIVNGGHFFILESINEVTKIVNKKIYGNTL